MIPLLSPKSPVPVLLHRKSDTELADEWDLFIPDMQRILRSLRLPAPAPEGSSELQKTKLRYLHQFWEAFDASSIPVVVFDDVQLKPRLTTELFKAKVAIQKQYKSVSVFTGTPPAGKDSPREGPCSPLLLAQGRVTGTQFWIG